MISVVLPVLISVFLILLFSIESAESFQVFSSYYNHVNKGSRWTACNYPTKTAAATTATKAARTTTTTTKSKNYCRRSLFTTFAPAAAVMPMIAGSITSPPIANAATNVPSVSEGMSSFAQNKVERSIEIYDSIIEEDPRRKPYLWQRGLSLYYAGRYKDGADQFKTDVAVNPNDTEEQIWHLLCLSKLDEVGSLQEARPMRLTVGLDRRPVMRLVQQLFLNDAVTETESTAEVAAERTLIKMTTTDNNPGNRFYASLYLSLYYESLNDEAQAKQYMTMAINTDYARSVGRRDPMVDVAKVAMQRRRWS